MNEIRETTGFRAGRDLLYVGDMLSVSGGNAGFVEVVKRTDGYYLADCSQKLFGFKNTEPDQDSRLNCNLPYSYQVVDPQAPFAEPSMKIYCSKCDETVTGTIDIETGETTWNENCADNNVNGDEIKSTCRLCAADPIRVEEKQRQRAEVEAYVRMKKQEFGMDEMNVLDLYGYFGSKEEVDIWFAANAAYINLLANLINYKTRELMEENENEQN